MAYVIACAPTAEEPGANFPSPTLGNFFLQQLRESAGNPFRACVRASARFHSRMAEKFGVDTPRGMAHYKLSEAFGNPTTKLQEFITKGGEFGNVPPKAVCKAHKDSINYHKKQAEKFGLHTPMGHAHISAMSHHVDELNQAKQKMQASQFGHTGRSSPVPGIPKKSDMPSQDIRQNKPLIKLKPRSGECNTGREASGDQYVAQRYDQSHPEGFKAPASGDIKPSGYDREAKAFAGRMKRFRRKTEARAFGRTGFGPVRGGEAEVAPPGWKGTIRHMKKHKDIEEPYALAWSMKKKGDKPHYEEASRPRRKSGMVKLPDGSGFFVGTVGRKKESAGWKNGSVLIRPDHLVAASRPVNNLMIKEF